MEQAVRVTQSARRDEEQPEPRTGPLSSKSHKLVSVPSVKDVDMPPAKATDSSRTAVPNWAITFFLGLLIGLVVLAYDALKKDIAEAKDHTESNKIRYQQLKEKLIEHGWRFKDDGTIITPMDDKPKQPEKGRR